MNSHNLILTPLQNENIHPLFLVLFLFGFVSCQEKLPDDESFITIPIKEVKKQLREFFLFSS